MRLMLVFYVLKDGPRKSLNESQLLCSLKYNHTSFMLIILIFHLGCSDHVIMASYTPLFVNANDRMYALLP